IVDEAHTCTRPPGRNVSQQQRHDLVSKLASDPSRHMLLVTATPHSGIEESFLSLLSLLKPEFGSLDTLHMQEQERAELARYFIQRVRGDVQKWLGENTPFPKRESIEESYQLSQAYRELFTDVYKFAHEMVKSGESLSGFKRRVRYWAALSLLRSLMSSPAAGAASLMAKAERLDTPIEDEEAESQFALQVYDIIDEEVSEDLEPNRAIQESETSLPDSDRKKLRRFAQRAEELSHTADEKLKTATNLVYKLLNDGYQPILYCRYIATAKYVSAKLTQELQKKFDSIRVECITSELSEDEREQRVQDLKDYDFRVLVATDCMSEGINLQEFFNAVIHYDLPWNPNRLEQREGRIDRYGQEKPLVKTILLYGKDNPIDGALLEVLIRKAVSIHKTLGIMVPVPVNNETVVQAVINSLFIRGNISEQLSLFSDSLYTIENFHRDWDRNAEREKESRTKFAQHAIKPAEVAEELKETDEILGDPKAVENFIIEACQRLNAPLVSQRTGWRFDPSPLPEVIKDRLQLSKPIRISFESPTPEGYVYIGRNHPLTSTLSQYLLETALDHNREFYPASRLSVIKTDSVSIRTTIFILRIRHLLETKDVQTPTLAEEIVITALSGNPNSPQWLPTEKAKTLLDTAAPKENISRQECNEILSEVISWIPSLQSSFEELAHERAKKLLESHKRVRKITHEGKLKVIPQLPVDVLGVYVLMPIVGRYSISTKKDEPTNRYKGGSV
ncbi:MAG: DEAD/DEAH box helicase, partial [Bacteroidetes bacterium]|nr:DEAD/DEAH box helicase [Bacteroidota bacterium]